jgi:hypothetical protein
MEWLTPQDIADGINGLPPIPIKTQNTLRSKRKVKYTKVGRRVVYKKEWWEEYIEQHTREPKTKAD